MEAPMLPHISHAHVMYP